MKAFVLECRGLEAVDLLQCGPLIFGEGLEDVTGSCVVAEMTQYSRGKQDP